MRLSKPAAVLVGLLTIWPILYFGLFLGFMLWTVLRAASLSSADGPPVEFLALMIGHVGTMLVMLGLVVFYVVHVFKNSAFDNQRRTLWALVLLLGGPVAMPIYWALHVWPKADRIAR